MCGSADPRSSNAVLLAAAVASLPSGTEVREIGPLTAIPGFEPGSAGGAAVAAMRAALDRADGLVITTPEYAHSVPGVVKNALDWLVGTGELATIPIALLSASPLITGGINAQIAVIRTLLAQGGEVVATLTVPESKRKIVDGAVVHESTRRRVAETMQAMIDVITERAELTGDHA